MSSRLWIPALVLLATASLRAQGPPSRTGVFGIPAEDELAVVSGQVQYRDGRPAAGIAVELESDEGATVARQQTDASGNFSFLGVRPGGYTVLASQSGFRTAQRMVRAAGRMGEAADALVLTLVPLAPDAAGAEAGQPVVSVRELQIPRKALAEYEKGVRSVRANRSAEAASHFERAVKIDPSFVEGFLRLGLIHAEQGDVSRADREINQAISLDPKNPDAYVALGYADQKAGDSAKAEAALRRAIVLQPDNWFAQMQLGDLLLSAKQPADALPHLLCAQQLRPQLAATYLLVYNALIFLGRGPEALKELDRYLARFPKDPDAAHLRGVREGLARAVSQASH